METGHGWKESINCRGPTGAFAGRHVGQLSYSLRCSQRLDEWQLTCCNRAILYLFLRKKSCFDSNPDDFHVESQDLVKPRSTTINQHLKLSMARWKLHHELLLGLLEDQIHVGQQRQVAPSRNLSVQAFGVNDEWLRMTWMNGCYRDGYWDG